MNNRSVVHTHSDVLFSPKEKGKSESCVKTKKTGAYHKITQTQKDKQALPASPYSVNCVFRWKKVCVWWGGRDVAGN